MSTTLAPPPPPCYPRRHRRAAARRPAARSAAGRGGLLRREWRQQVLVLALLIVAVAATTVGLGLVVNVQATDQGVFGTAERAHRHRHPGPTGVAADLAAARQRFGTVEAITHASVPVPGSVTPVDLRAQDPHGVFGEPMLRLVSGTLPGRSRPGGGDQGRRDDVQPEGRIELAGQRADAARGRHRREPQGLAGRVRVGGSRQIRSPSSVTLLFDASGRRRCSFHPPAGTVQGISASASHSAQQQRNQALAVLLLATIGLSFIGLLSVAGFTVMAQRTVARARHDRRDRRHRPASAAGHAGQRGRGRLAWARSSGAVLGLVVWFALTPAFEQVVGHRYDPFALPWWAVLTGALLAILTALAASWWPARAAAGSRSSRRCPVDPPRRSPPTASPCSAPLLAAAGFVALILAHAVHTRADRGPASWPPRRACCYWPPSASGRWPPSPGARPSRSAWRCATWPATRPAPAPRWPRPASPSASPPPSP